MAQLTPAQRDAAIPWCRTNDCCLRLAVQLVDGESVQQAQGCIGRCPVTGQTGGKRKQTEINELAKLLELPVTS